MLYQLSYASGFVLALTLRAGDGTRTRDIKLGRLALYQLSYSRMNCELRTADYFEFRTTANSELRTTALRIADNCSPKNKPTPSINMVGEGFEPSKA